MEALPEMRGVLRFPPPAGVGEGGEEEEEEEGSDEVAGASVALFLMGMEQRREGLCARSGFLERDGRLV